MIARLCQHVIAKREKIAFMLNESVTNASKSVLIIYIRRLDGSLPANPVNDRRVANAVTLKSTFCLP